MEWILLTCALFVMALGEGAIESDTQLQVVSPSVSIVRGYNEPCTCDSDCDFSRWLACHSGFCVCLSKTFLYDYTRETCVVRLGQKCFEVAQDYSQYKELPPFIRCVQGAFCSISIGGLCACNSYGFYESKGQSCEPKKAFGDPCAKSVECKSEACSTTTGLCACRDGHYFHRSRERCVGEVGSFCFTDEECTENAICNSHTAKCACLPQFSRTKTGGLCARKLSHGDACNASTPCNNPQLSCFSGTCQCAYPNHQLYDEVTSNCRSLVSSAPCQGHETCVPHANCVRLYNNELRSVCHCEPGFLEMSNGTCAKFSAYGAECMKDEECDPVPKLVCKDSICQCQDGLTTYDSMSRLCRGLNGFRNCHNQFNVNLCVQNSRCVHTNPALPSKCISTN